MTAVALIPIAVTCFIFGAGLTAPLAHRAGRRSVARDRDDISRILGGVDAPSFADGLPVQHGTIAEHRRRQELVRHAAPPPDIDWHRNEHRIWSWGWCVEVVQRLASVGYKPTLPVAVEDHRPRHAAWNVSTQELRIVVEREARRRDDEFEAQLYAMVAKGVVLR